MAIQKEIWTRAIVEGLFASNSFLSKAFNADEYVEAGKIVHIPQAGVDTDFLKQAAQRTNGLFFMVEDRQALGRAYREISRNEPLSEASVYLIQQRELYFWPLLAFVLIISGIVFQRTAQRITFHREDD